LRQVENKKGRVMKNIHRLLLIGMLSVGQLSCGDEGVVDYVSKVVRDNADQESYLTSLYHKFLAWIESSKMSDEEREAFYENDEDSHWSKEQDKKFVDRDAKRDLADSEEINLASDQNSDDKKKSGVIHWASKSGAKVEQKEEEKDERYHKHMNKAHDDFLESEVKAESEKKPKKYSGRKERSHAPSKKREAQRKLMEYEDHNQDKKRIRFNKDANDATLIETNKESEAIEQKAERNLMRDEDKPRHRLDDSSIKREELMESARESLDYADYVLNL